MKAVTPVSEVIKSWLHQAHFVQKFKFGTKAWIFIHYVRVLLYKCPAQSLLITLFILNLTLVLFIKRHPGIQMTVFYIFRWNCGWFKELSPLQIRLLKVVFVLFLMLKSTWKKQVKTLIASQFNIMQNNICPITFLTMIEGIEQFLLCKTKKKGFWQLV